MTVREAIVQTDGLRPNQYTEEDKLRWLSECEHSVYEDIILTHEIPLPFLKKFKVWHPFTEENMDEEMIVPYPFDKLYPAFLKMKIDEENQETQRYNVSAQMFNAYLEDYAKHINKFRKPVGRNRYHIY